MKKLILTIAFLLTGTVLPVLTEAQSLMDKLKQEAQDKVSSKLSNGKSNSNSNNSSGTNQNSSNSGNSSTSTNNKSATNTKGGGLSASNVDVSQSIADAGSAYSAKKYSDSKYNIRQAIMGVELEMGKDVLKMLPETVLLVTVVKEKDQVTSTGAGFVGLSIVRQYKKNDQELNLTIANNSPWLSSVNMYLSNSSYATSNNNQQNYKQIKFQDFKGIIEYNQSTGYKLSVPFGQTSIFVLNGINYDNENSFMEAANIFSISAIMNKLGEK